VRSLIRLSDINCVCVGDADTLLLLWIFCSFFLFLIPLFHGNLRSLLFLETGSVELKLNTLCSHAAHVSIGGRLLNVTIRSQNYNFSKLCYTLQRGSLLTVVACSYRGHCRSMPFPAETGKNEHVTCQPRVAGDRRLKHRQRFSSSETLECNSLFNKSYFCLPYN